MFGTAPAEQHRLGKGALNKSAPAKFRTVDFGWGKREVGEGIVPILIMVMSAC